MASKKKPAVKKAAPKKAIRNVLVKIEQLEKEKAFLKRLAALEENVRKAVEESKSRIEGYRLAYVRSTTDLAVVASTVEGIKASLQDLRAAKKRSEIFRVVPPEAIEQIEGRLDVQDETYAILDERVRKIENSPAQEAKIIERAVRIQDRIRAQRPKLAEMAITRVKMLEEKVAVLEKTKTLEKFGER